MDLYYPTFCYLTVERKITEQESETESVRISLDDMKPIRNNETFGSKSSVELL